MPTTLTFQSFLTALYSNILYPVLSVVFALALVYFLYGVMKFIYAADDDKAREIGKRHMIYGIIGLVIMFGAISIVAIIRSTVGSL